MYCFIAALEAAFFSMDLTRLHSIPPRLDKATASKKTAAGFHHVCLPFSCVSHIFFYLLATYVREDSDRCHLVKCIVARTQLPSNLLVMSWYEASLQGRGMLSQVESFSTERSLTATFLYFFIGNFNKARILEPLLRWHAQGIQVDSFYVYVCSRANSRPIACFRARLPFSGRHALQLPCQCSGGYWKNYCRSGVYYWVYLSNKNSYILK